MEEVHSVNENIELKSTPLATLKKCCVAPYGTAIWR